MRIPALRLGNSNNDLIAGPACVNLSDEASSANWASGVGLVLLLVIMTNAPIFLHHWPLKHG